VSHSPSILADEDVPRVVVTALQSSGYDVTRAADRYGEGTDDAALLADAADREEVLLTHDRDFIALAAATDHNGVFVLTSQSPEPGAVVRGVDRLTATVTAGELANELVWIEDWA
jgi:hypothetical protein